MLAAIARSKEDPLFGTDAGERLTVTRVYGHVNPAIMHADLTLSLASASDVSGSPMMEKAGSPGLVNAWIWIVYALSPHRPMEKDVPIGIISP